jgi:putative effector of murein hydrolase
VVGLAVPLAREWRGVRRLAFPIAASLVVGSVVAATSAVAIAWALGVSPATLASLVPKSVTAPVAMGIAERRRLPRCFVFAVATGVVGRSSGATCSMRRA